MSKIIPINDYTPRSGESFFFDCNVWIFNFCPIGGSSKAQQKIYSSFLKNIIANKARIIVNSLVLSEFSNRYLRFDFDLWKKSTDCLIPDPQFKRDYIPSGRYVATVRNVKQALENIVKLSDKMSDDFYRIELNDVHRYFEKIDFNDCYYYEFCRNNDHKLVTDDQDFVKIEDEKVIILSRL